MDSERARRFPSPGSTLGPYELGDELGAGGMGHVYRARDPRLDREVAVKVLQGSPGDDRLRRFEQEARALARLSHPNILAVYDVGRDGDVPYVVFELLEGETLRERLGRGAIPPRKAIGFAGQIAEGLAAAHDKGIVHRDLKPENVIVGVQGRVKILDFGLAKLLVDPAAKESRPPVTNQGTLLGTVGYMSPEQVRGEPVDHRADIFALGAIVYEMLTGQRAFQGDTAVETMNAILKEDPPLLAPEQASLTADVARMLRHCLEREPEERFQSAHDLAFALHSLTEPSGSGRILAALAPRRGRRWWPAVTVGLVGVGVLTAALLAIRAQKSTGSATYPTPPTFQRMTFRRGQVWAARFDPRGGNVIYSASWDQGRVEVLSTRPDRPGSRSLGLRDATLLSLSAQGDLAISLGPGYPCGGCLRTLARVPLAGGAPRSLLADVVEADWLPDGRDLVVVRMPQGLQQLEFPIGHIVYQTTGWIGAPRVSPDGRLVAFWDRPITGDDRGAVAVVDRHGHKRTLGPEWSCGRGLSWWPDGKEIWFTASPAGTERALHAVTLAGVMRTIARMPTTLTLLDISRDGNVLLATEEWRMGIRVGIAGRTREKDLSWLDFSRVMDLSADAGRILLDESGAGGGPSYSVYLRRTDGSAPVRLGDGTAGALSPDGRWAISIQVTSRPRQVVLLPAGTGRSRQVTTGMIDQAWAQWFPDGKRLLLLGREPGRAARLYVQDLAGGRARPISPPGLIHLPAPVLSPDGRWVIAQDASQRNLLFSVAGHAPPKPVPGLEVGDEPVRWIREGLVFISRRVRPLPIRLFLLDPQSGRRKRWREIMPLDPTGMVAVRRVFLTPDGRSYAYSYERRLSQLYLAQGWR